MCCPGLFLHFAVRLLQFLIMISGIWPAFVLGPIYFFGFCAVLLAPGAADMHPEWSKDPTDQASP